MNTEERLRRTMQRELEGMPEIDDLEARFDARRRRYRRVQMAQYGAVLAVIVAVAAVVVPRLGDEPRDFFTPGGDDPTPTPTASEPPANHAVDRFVGYQVELPAGWARSADEGALSAFGPADAGDLGEPGSAMITSSYYALVTPTNAVWEDEVARLRHFYTELESIGVSWTETTEVGVAGRPTVSFGVVWPENVSEEFGSDEGFCPRCRIADYLVYWPHGKTVRIELVARGAQANETWGAEGLRFVETFRVLETPGSVYQPEHGSAAEGVTVDEATETAMLWMDARVNGNEADRWMTREAEALYASGGGNLSLYSPTSNPHYASYVIVAHEAVDANSYEIVVEIVEEFTGQGETGRFRETLSVGPGTNTLGSDVPFVIRGGART